MCVTGFRWIGREELARSVDSAARRSCNMRRHPSGDFYRHSRYERLSRAVAI